MLSPEEAGLLLKMSAFMADAANVCADLEDGSYADPFLLICFNFSTAISQVFSKREKGAMYSLFSDNEFKGWDQPLCVEE